MSEQLATGLAWPEGPTVLPDGRIVFVETYRSHIGYVAPDGEYGQFAYTAGGPNATALGSDGCLYVTQNGGVVGPWRADEMLQPSIQRITPDGAIETVATEIAGVPFQAPNDLAFGPDGRLYFTDPGRYDPAALPDPGRIFALDPSGGGELRGRAAVGVPERHRGRGVRRRRVGRVLHAPRGAPRRATAARRSSRRSPRSTSRTGSRSPPTATSTSRR